MKLKKVFVMLISSALIISCQSNKDFFTVGTSASIYNIDPFPEPSTWIKLIDSLNVDINTNSSLLWLVGAYSLDGIKMNFPGNDDIDNGIYFSDIDFNEQFLSQFDKSDGKVYLTLEPGTADVGRSIELILTRYGNHRSVAGVALDLEWLFNANNGAVTAVEIERWSNIVLAHNKSYKLILKHWNRKKIELYPEDSVVYIQNMQGISNLNEIIARNKTWSRYFYPSFTGLELGYDSDIVLWDRGNHPLFNINGTINGDSERKSSIFWSESSLHHYIP